VAHLEAAFGVALDPDLLQRALTHRSYAYENGGLPTNERLEFLGDAVLGLVVTVHIFQRFPDEAEGRLAKLRAAAVNTSALAAVGRSLAEILAQPRATREGLASPAGLLAEGLVRVNRHTVSSDRHVRLLPYHIERLGFDTKGNGSLTLAQKRVVWLLLSA
jgi:hypothetical protein